MSLKHIPLLACAMAVFTSSASAQFTAAVVPPAVKAKSDTTVVKDSVRRATVALAARVTDMRKWVDSAAGVSIAGDDSNTTLASSESTVRDTAGAGRAAKQVRDSTSKVRDSTSSRTTRVRTDSAATIATVEVHDSTGLRGSDSAASLASTPGSRRDTRSFRNGATAPATGTMLPFFAIAGVTTLLAGLALRRT
ncbi:MAG: hypothetical protein ABI889_05150 [Gemmatimonadota bacterium]